MRLQDHHQPVDILICDEMADRMSSQRKMQKRPREETEGSDSALHSDAGDDLRVIQQQLRQFQDQPQERESIIQDKLETVQNTAITPYELKDTESLRE